MMQQILEARIYNCNTHFQGI